MPYCLPFMSTFMVLDNQANLEWLLYMALSFLLLAMLVDWVSFLILLPAGVIAGALTYHIGFGSLQDALSDGRSSVFIAYICLFSLLIGLIFSRRKDVDDQDKRAQLKVMAGAIAHELRTPLATLNLAARRLGKDGTAEEVQQTSLRMQKVVSKTSTFIDIMLMKLKEVSKQQSLRPFSISQLTQEALDFYPMSEEDRSLVSWKGGEDFIFMGDESLYQHIIFNLLKNGLYYVKAANKGKIEVWHRREGNVNRLYFKDTGQGMNEETLQQVFNQFYTRTRHGTGIGLSFCQEVMRSFHGTIHCESVEGEYTTFILSFPVVSVREEFKEVA